MPSPEVIDGTRAPRSVRLDDIRKGTEALSALPTPKLAPDGVTVYVSSTRGYLVEVKNTKSFVHDGERIPAQRIAAQFVEGVYRNDHPDPEVRKLIDERLQRNKYFGVFGGGPKVHFWLASDQQARTEAARVKGALATLKALPPEVVAQYAAELAQGDGEDHELPAIEAAAAPSAKRAAARPIPPTAE